MSLCLEKDVQEGAAMASRGVGMNTGSSANEAPEIPENVGDWFPATSPAIGMISKRNSILTWGLFAARIWRARNLSDIDLMASQPGVEPDRHTECVLDLNLPKTEPPACDYLKTCPEGS